MQVKIICGISGAGKSTYVRNYKLNYQDMFVLTCSADDYFYRQGKYEFHALELPEAHAQCLRKFTEALQKGRLNDSAVLFVDNTNTSIAEVAPYAALALAYGADLEIVILECPVEKAFARNTHGVPLKGVQGQNARLATLADSLPPWWPVTRVQAE